MKPKEPRTLADVPPDERGTPYAAWKAKQLNELFREHGTAPSSILPSTVEHGLKKYEESRRKD